MSDLKTYIANRRATDAGFDDGFDDGYKALKIGMLLRQARENSGLTQEEMAQRLCTQKPAEDIRLSTLTRFAAVLDRKIEVSIR
jgi:hypothetical protein